ncbi:MAG: RNA polymerase sigma factor [Nitrospiraceae bacterium]
MKTAMTNRADADPLSAAAGNSVCMMNQEDQLLSQLRAGEEEAFETVVIHYQERLTRTAMRYVANRATAEDIVQETWIAVMNGLNRFEGRSSLYAWICAILIHKAKDRGIREKRQKVFSSFELETDHRTGEPDPSRCRRQGEEAWTASCSRHCWDDRTPEQLLVSRQTTACLWQAIETLPALQKDVLMLRDVQGIHTQEVCKQLKISETNLYVRLHRARERVKVAVTAALG